MSGKRQHAAIAVSGKRLVILLYPDEIGPGGQRHGVKCAAVSPFDMVAFLTAAT